MANTWFEKKEQRKTTCGMDRNKAEVDFVLADKSNRKYLNDVKAILDGNRHGQKKVDGSSEQ